MVEQAPHRGLTKLILAAAFEVHTPWTWIAGEHVPGMSAYELTKRGLRVELQVPVPVIYDGQKLPDVGYRLDVLVNDTIVLDGKKLRQSPRSIVRSYCLIFDTQVSG